MSVDLVRIIDSIHRDKNIPKDVLFEGIQSALQTAAKKHFPEAADISVTIDQDNRSSGFCESFRGGCPHAGRSAGDESGLPGEIICRVHDHPR